MQEITARQEEPKAPSTAMDAVLAELNVASPLAALAAAYKTEIEALLPAADAALAAAQALLEQHIGTISTVQAWVADIERLQAVANADRAPAQTDRFKRMPRLLREVTTNLNNLAHELNDIKRGQERWYDELVQDKLAAAKLKNWRLKRLKNLTETPHATERALEQLQALVDDTERWAQRRQGRLDRAAASLLPQLPERPEDHEPAYIAYNGPEAWTRATKPYTHTRRMEIPDAHN